MTWFLLALVGPLLYAITNHIDKILLTKFFREGGVGTLILFSSLLSVFAIPFLFLGDTSVFAVEKKHIAVLTGASLLNISVLWFYLLALKDNDASVVIVFYQLVPVFGLVFGYLFLGEMLTPRQLAAMGIIIFGASLVSFEIDEENGFRLRGAIVGYMLGAVTCWALQSVIFKAVALKENVWRSLFWEHVMLVAVGILIFLFIPAYRRHFLKVFRTNSAAVLALNAFNEGAYMLGSIVVAFAYMLAPVALVLLAESFQPIFVFAIGVFLTVFFPRLSRENIRPRSIGQKLAAIAITGVGTYVLLSS